MNNIEKYFEPLVDIRRKKVERFYIPPQKQYQMIHDYNYTISQMKEICKYYKIKFKSNIKKSELRNRCYHFMKFNLFSSRLQKIYRSHLIHLFNKTQGICKFNRSKCNNVDDFLTTEKMSEISYYYFVSYLDEDGFSYGFHLSSLYNLFKNNDYKNPYTRNYFSNDFVQDVFYRIHLNQILKYNKLEYIKKEDISTLHAKTVTLFQKMDELDNYTKIDWLTDLNINKLILLFRELYDIWNWRAQLTLEVKKQICPPNGNPFSNVNMHLLNNSNIPNDLESVYL